MGVLKLAQEDLAKEKDNKRLVAMGYERVAQAIRMLDALDTQSEVSMEKRLQKIENAINGITARTAQGTKSWAAVAAKPAILGQGLPVPPVKRPAVRVRLDEPAKQEDTASDLLAKVKPAIPMAIAVRKLQSGDVDVFVKDQTAKDLALCQNNYQGLKVLRQDYVLEIPGVPLNLQVTSGLHADNGELIRRIKKDTARLNPTLEITMVRWLHDVKAQSKRNQETGKVKTKGTLLVHCPTQEIQHRAVKSGIVIDAQLYEARLFDSSVLLRQCYKCAQWGHTQSACGKQAKCSKCAGNHDTRQCKESRVECANCGGKHKAWQKQACRVFQAYLNATQERRVLLRVESDRVRATDNSSSPSPPTSSDGFTIVANKRRRGNSPSPAVHAGTAQARRTVGRPTYLSQAAADPSQAKIGMWVPSGTSAGNSALGDDMELSQDLGSQHIASNEQ